MLAQTCSFAAARADLGAVLAARPGQRSASEELAKLDRAEAALQAARDSRHAHSTMPRSCDPRKQHCGEIMSVGTGLIRVLP